MKFLLVYALIFNLIFCNKAYSQPEDFVVNVNLLGPDRGLKETNASILQDYLGFVWVSSPNYLLRYDGYRFEDFTYLLGDSSTNNFGILVQGANGNLWIQRSKKIYQINPKTLVVKDILFDKNPYLKESTYDCGLLYPAGNFIWVCCSNGFAFRLDENGKPDIIYKPKVSDIIGRIKNAWVDSLGNNYINLWPNIIDVWGKNGAFVKRVTIPVDKKVYKGQTYYFSLFRTGSPDELVAEYKTDGARSAVEYTFNVNKPGEGLRLAAERPLGVIDHASPAPGGGQWIVGNFFIGYRLLDKEYNLTTKITQKTGENVVFVNSAVGRDGTLWVVMANGLAAISVKQKPFKTYLSTAQFKDLAKPVSVRTFVETGTGDIIVSSYSTYKSGKTGNIPLYSFYRLDKSTGNVRNLPLKDTSSHGYYTNELVMMKIVKVANKFFGVADGAVLWEFDKNFTTCKPYTFTGHELFGFKTLIALSDSILWVGGEKGMLQYNIKSDTAIFFNDFKQPNYIKNLRVRQFSKAGGDKYWAAASDGVYLLDNRGIIEQYYGKKNNASIYVPFTEAKAIYITNGVVWVATADEGVFAIDTATRKITRFSEDEGVANNKTTAIVPDVYGNMWISTYGGISRLDIKTKEFINFTTSDGLANNEFNYSAFLSSTDRKIYFGSVNGFVKIDPENFRQRTDTLFNHVQLVQFSKYSAKQKKQLTYDGFGVGDKLDIAPDESFLTFRVMTGDYQNLQTKTFRYKLTSLETGDWKVLKVGNEISFASLPAGNYTLHVQASNDGKSWGENDLVIAINVHPYWYKTWWMYLLVAVFSIMISVAVYFVRLRRYKEILDLKNGISADLHDEVGSTLSSISLYSQVLINQPEGQKDVAMLGKIKANAQHIQQNLRDIVWSMKLFDEHFNETVRHMFNFGNELLEAIDIFFDMVADEETRKKKIAIYKQKELYLVFKEAITKSAANHGCSKVQVRLFLSNRGRQLNMTINADGHGFSSDDSRMPKMQQRAQRLGGKLEIVSAIDKGTTISLSVNV